MSAAQKRRIRLAFAGVVATVLAAFMAFAVAAPASADETKGVLEVTDSSVVQLQQESTLRGGNDDECSGNKVCKRIPWCPPHRPSHSPSEAPSLELSDDAPMVALGDKGGDGPRCVEKPKKLDYVCCVDGKGVQIQVYNPNEFKLKVRIWLGNGEPITKWIGGKSTAKYLFTDVVNGDYVVHSAVWAGGNNWCKFKFKHAMIKVKCPTATPSTSASPSVSPSASPSASGSPAPSMTPVGNVPELPQTGAKTGVLVTGGLLVLAAGAGLAFAFRRRRVEGSLS